MHGVFESLDEVDRPGRDAVQEHPLRAVSGQEGTHPDLRPREKVVCHSAGVLRVLAGRAPLPVLRSDVRKAHLPGPHAGRS